jgi:hypothetical protein
VNPHDTARNLTTRWRRMPVSNHSQPVTLSGSLASRYEALARIAELIRYHPEEKVLFQTCASELHEVVAFDGLSLVRSGSQLGPVAFPRAL